MPTQASSRNQRQIVEQTAERSAGQEIAGEVLAEAHGPFARTVSGGTISGQAKRKYCRQMKPHLAAESPYGRIVYGHSIAFGSKPGDSGAFLHVAKAEIPTPGTERSPDTEPPAGSG